MQAEANAATPVWVTFLSEDSPRTSGEGKVCGEQSLKQSLRGETCRKSWATLGSAAILLFVDMVLAVGELEASLDAPPPAIIRWYGLESLCQASMVSFPANFPFPLIRKQAPRVRLEQRHKPREYANISPSFLHHTEEITQKAS